MAKERRKQLDDEDFARWCSWLGRIQNEICGLLTNRYIFRKVQEIYLGNPELHWDDTFPAWMQEMYAHASSATIRRLVDRHEDSVSFARLLEKIAKSPKVLSRERFVGFYRGQNLPADVGERAFERLWGKGAQEAAPASLRRDIQELDVKASGIKAYVDIRIAHHDMTSHKIKNLPTWKEFDECLDFIEELLKKYLLALRAESCSSVVPTWQYDWTKVFTVPWIASRKAVNY